jgi:hypothetical protein
MECVLFCLLYPSNYTSLRGSTSTCVCALIACVHALNFSRSHKLLSLSHPCVSLTVFCRETASRMCPLLQNVFSSIECVLRLSDSVLQNTFYRSEHILQKRTHSTSCLSRIQGPLPVSNVPSLRLRLSLTNTSSTSHRKNKYTLARKEIYSGLYF